MGVNDARFGAAVAACDIYGSIGRELLEQGNRRQLRKRPGIRHEDQNIDAGLAELLGHNIRLSLAVNKNGRINHRNRGPIGHYNSAANHIRGHFDYVSAARTAGIVNSRVAGGEDADYGNFGGCFANVGQMGGFCGLGHFENSFFSHGLTLFCTVMSFGVQCTFYKLLRVQASCKLYFWPYAGYLKSRGEGGFVF
jgi:hypothetical protein